MKKRFRSLCLILAVLFCMGVFAGCNSGDNTSNGSGTGEGADEAFPYSMQLDPKDPIRILCVDTERHKYGVQQFDYLEELEGNTINSAVQERNNRLEELYGLTFEVSAEQYPSDQMALLIQGNTDEYDIICESVDRLTKGIPQGFYWALDEYMDISHPWWDEQASESLTLGSKHYLLTGDAIITDDDHTYCTLFNKKMYDTNAAVSAHGDIYEIVRNGEFTIDLYYEMCKAVSAPDENGAWSIYATYGNVSHAYGATVMMNGCDIATVRKNEDDELYITVAEENSIKAFDKVYELMSDSQNTVRAEWLAGKSPTVSSQYGFAEMEELFINGRGLFYNGTSSSISILKSKNLDFEVGVLPIPKYNKEQENYCNTVNRYQSSAIAIPVTVPEDRLEMVTFALQALGYYNDDVIYAYYDTTLQLQGVQSDDDAQMLDIIYDNRFYDIGIINEWGKLTSLYGNCIANASTNTLVSSWEAMASQVEVDMEAAIKAYEDAGA